MITHYATAWQGETQPCVVHPCDDCIITANANKVLMAVHIQLLGILM